MLLSAENPMKNIRGKAVVILECEGKFLFTVGHDHVKCESLYVPVGGGIEFGEYALDAAKREVKEEIGQEITNEVLLDISENIFEYNGIQEHEIVFAYRAEFLDEKAYEMELKGVESDGKAITLTWLTVEEIQQRKNRIYPESIRSFLLQEKEGGG